MSRRREAVDVEEDAGDHDVEDADEEEEEEPEEEEDPEPVEDRGPAKSLTRAQLLQALSGLTATPDRCNYAYSILNLADLNLKDLKGVDAFTSLQHVNITRNQLANISALSSLSNLLTLYAGRNKLEDLEPLQSLPYLQVLDLTRALSPSMDTFQGDFDLPCLHKLVLSYNKLRALSFSGCTSLHTLVVDHNRLTSLSGIGATSVKEVDASNNIIRSLDGLAELTELRVLKLSRNRLKSLAQVAEIELESLQALDITSNRLPDVSELAHLKSLLGLKHIRVGAPDGSEYEKQDVLEQFRDFLPGEEKLESINGKLISREDRLACLEAFKEKEAARLAEEREAARAAEAAREDED